MPPTVNGAYSLALYGDGHELRGVSACGNVTGGARFGHLYPNKRPADIDFQRNVERGTGAAIAS